MMGEIDSRDDETFDLRLARSACKRLHEHFFPHHEPHLLIQSIGYSKDRIMVYLKKKDPQNVIPKTWEGFPVVTRVVGEVVIGFPEE